MPRRQQRGTAGTCGLKGAPSPSTRIGSQPKRDDGRWVLRTNTTLPAMAVALTYKQLWMVEEMFRSMKSLLTTRPIWHKCDETTRGHVLRTYLALVLREALEDRLEAAGVG